MTITLERTAAVTTTAVTTTAVTEVVRIHPVPRSEPPYDDELGIPYQGGTPLTHRHAPGRHSSGPVGLSRSWPDQWGATQPGPSRPGPAQPELSHSGRQPGQSQPGAGEDTAAHTAPGMAEGGQAPGDGPAAQPQPAGRGRGGGRTGSRTAAPRRPQTPAELAAVRFLKGYGEVLAGFRPVRHLAPLIAPEVYETVSAHLLQPRRGGHLGPSGTGWRTGFMGAQPGSTLRPGTGATGVPVPGLGRRTGAPGPVQGRTYRVCEPVEGVAEVSAVFARGAERWAVALRLERRTAGWVCTVLQVI